MKKNRALLCTCVLLFAAFLFVLSGCSVLNSLIKLDAPQISVIGNTIFWSNVEDATEYEIYKNKELYLVTNDNYCVVNNLTEASQFYVIAKNNNAVQNSIASNKVAVSKNDDFSDNETLNLDLSQTSQCTVPSSKSYVKVTGSSSNAAILVANRNSDLVLHLQNVSMTSPQGRSCISTVDDTYDTDSNHFVVIIIVEGENELNGGSCTTTPSQPDCNSGKNGTNGVDGGCGIILPKIVFVGNGWLVVNGGNGGNGGQGADSQGIAMVSRGEGGNGGNGGDGIRCTQLVMSMEITGRVNLYSGLGGKGGDPGVNGSILSGPIISISGNKGIGKTGTKGNSLIGETLIFGGTLSS